MFDSLRKKFSVWLKKPIKTKEKPTKKSKEKQTGEIRKKGKKTEKKIETREIETPLELKQEAELQEKNVELEIKEEDEEEVKIEEKTEEIKEQTAKEKKKFKFWSFGKKEEKKIQDLKEDIEKESEKEVKIEEKLDAEVKEEKENFFSKLIKKIKSSELTQKAFDEIFQELEITLLENNTALQVVDKIKSSLSTDLVGKDIKRDKIESTVIASLKNSILSVLIEPPNLIQQIKSKTGLFVILFFGINGSGKTTSVAKLAYLLKQQNISVVLAAGDTFRAAAIDQLEAHANKIKVPIIKSNYGADPASVAFDAIKYANQHKIKCVLIDTAGRMYTKSNLMKEMEKIVRISKPDLKIFVGESITGNDVISQSQTFNDTIGIDGSILTKSDIDEKGGAILSVSYVTKKPIYYLGVGQSYSDLKPFTKSEVLKNLGL